jgi:putative phosphoesterase
MKIVVLADTHISDPLVKFPRQLIDAFKDCDMIVHAGDLTEAPVLDAIRLISEVKAVAGNMDSIELKKMLPEKIVFKAGKITIGVTHGKGTPNGILKNVSGAFKSKPDVIIFGHSHIPFSEKIGGSLYFNPGSLNDRVFAPYRSFGILDIRGESVMPHIVRLDNDF